MRCSATLLCTVSLFAAIAQAAPAGDLFNGPDLAGWEFVTRPAVDIKQVCALKSDGVLVVTRQPVGFLATTASYANFHLHAEWRWPAQPGNSGILVHSSSGPLDRAWPLCLRAQTKRKNVGDVLPMGRRHLRRAAHQRPGCPDRHQGPHRPCSEKPAGEWNTCDLTCRDDKIEVVINSVLQNTVTRVTPAAGRVGFQFEGVPFELRNVRPTPLD